MPSNEKSFLQTTQQLAGIESINTTRLIHLKSWQADINNSATDKTWVIPKANKRSYLQHRISLQQLKMWNTFKTIPNDITLQVQVGTKSIDMPVFSGNWPPDALAYYLSSSYLASDAVNITWDPYQLRFVFCPGIIVLPNKNNKYIGFPESGSDGQVVQISEFPPVNLFGVPAITVWTNFTMNNIPVSDYLCCVPVGVPYGSYIHFTNYDNSMSSLCLDPDINHIRVILKDDHGDLLDYPESLDWEVVLALQPTVPEGFAPLEL